MTQPDKLTINNTVTSRLNRGECPNCGQLIGTMMAAEQFHSCKEKTKDDNIMRDEFEV